MTDGTPSTHRAFVLGLDGVPWTLLDRYTDQGALPNMRRLREDGVAGPLQSTKLANTPVAWPSIASGKRPDAHGLYEFFQLESDYSQQPHTSEDLGASMLWDVVQPAVLGNVPMTYPPPELDGKAVSGMMTPTLDDAATHPSDLAAEISDRLPDYRIALDWGEYKGHTDEFLDDLRTLVASRRRLLDLLMGTDDWRLFFFVFTAPDRLQHLLWDEDVILEHYRTLDEIVGDVLEYCIEREATLIVVSDHGFGPISKSINVNRILATEGFLTGADNTGTRGLLKSAGLTKDRVLTVLERVGISDETLVNSLPKPVLDSIATRIPGSHARYDVDFTETAAFLHGQGSIYVNDTERFENGIVPPHQRDRIVQDVHEVLDTLSDPETGQSVLNVWFGDRCYPRDDRSPDLVIEPAKGYVVSAALEGDTFGDVGDTDASHRRQGTFFAWGPDVASGVEIESATVLDVTPTLLHAIGAPIPEDADGAPLDAVYEDGSVPASTDPRTVRFEDRATSGDGIEDFAGVEERLRGLGYVE
jgi:predicted AlkP superfamily phosphohydrolase/phosphomutase